MGSLFENGRRADQMAGIAFRIFVPEDCPVVGLMGSSPWSTGAFPNFRD
jgi:hypothetical protein